MTEEWKPLDLPWAKDPYEVSNLARVRNARTGRVLKTYDSPSNGGVYKKVDCGRKHKHLYPHRLSQWAFGRDPRGLQVDHLEKDLEKNGVEDTEVVSNAENQARRAGKGDAYETPGAEDTSFNPEELERKQA